MDAMLDAVGGDSRSMSPFLHEGSEEVAAEQEQKKERRNEAGDRGTYRR
jgi:hypothetical protein